MKRFCLIVVVFLFPLFVCAQQVTTFLGIPVDGSKSRMIQKLKAKGFRSSSFENPDVLEGEFNGRKVNIHVVTNKNKVYRIMVSDVNNVDETSIRIRFNTLIRQFDKNDKYISLLEDNKLISDDEDISYEMSVKSKRYQASFYQRTSLIDSVLIEFYKTLTSVYPENWTQNITDTMASDIAEYIKLYVTPYLKTSVWFMISEFKGKYYISMYYDNEYNMANGEDL